MPAEMIHSWAIWAAVAAAALAAWGEWLHARRVARIGRLAFGPAGKPRPWTKAVPLVRVAAAAGMAWALVSLLAYDNRTRDRSNPNRVARHLMILLDVSPSMLLKDSGEDGSLTRKHRAGEVLRSVLDRAADDETRFSIAGFYTEARPLANECRDRELILHIATDLPYHITYQPGKTDLLKALNQAGAMMKDWPRKSTTLLVLSDGDTVAPSGLDPMPPAVRSVVIAGLGDPNRGSFIDGHLSRQDTGHLGQLARRLGGSYYNCNSRPLPGEALAALTAVDTGSAKWRTDRRLLALGIFALCATAWCLLPLLLESFGSGWRRRHAAPSTQPALPS